LPVKGNKYGLINNSNNNNNGGGGDDYYASNSIEWREEF
jgi:hypothetical protein